MNELCKEACVDCVCAEKRGEPIYEIIITLGDEAFNKEFGLYVFPSIKWDEQPILSKVPDIVFETTELWRVSEWLCNKGVKTLIVNKK